MYIVTINVRLPSILNRQLSETSHSLHRDKDWIIAKALEEYLSHINYPALAEEAKRQSLLACQSDAEENKLWEDNSG